MITQRINLLIRIMFVVVVQLAISFGAAGQSGTIRLISSGDRGEGGGSYAVLSGNGQIVVFESAANDLASLHLTGSWDVYAQNIESNERDMVSAISSGLPVDNPGDYPSPPSVSQDGRFVAFVSQSCTLVPNDCNGVPNVFIKDRFTGEIDLLSVSTSGQKGTSASFQPAISDDGRYAAFQSFSSNLVVGDNNQSVDIFVHDRELHTTEIASVSDSGEQGSDTNEYGYSAVAISGDGRFIAFSYEQLIYSSQPGSSSPSIFLRDRLTRTTRMVAPGDYPAFSSNGRFLVFVSSEPLVKEDTNQAEDVYLFDRSSSRFERISVSESGAQVNDQFFVSPPDVSNDGRMVVFSSNARLTQDDTGNHFDIYLRDRYAAQTRLLSLAPGGNSGYGDSQDPTISDSGTRVAFSSFANNLVSPDNNTRSDVFVIDIIADALPVSVQANLYLPILTTP